MPYLADYDPKVREAAGRAYQAVAKTAPAARPAQSRYPDQPVGGGARAAAHPRDADIAGAGTLEIELNPSEAPGDGRALRQRSRAPATTTA